MALLPLRSIYNSWHGIFLASASFPWGGTFFKNGTGLPDATLQRSLSDITEDLTWTLLNPSPLSKSPNILQDCVSLTMPSVCLLGLGKGQPEKHLVSWFIVSWRFHCLGEVKDFHGLHVPWVMRLCHSFPIWEDFFRP